MITPEQIESLDFAKGGGLLPAVVQDAASQTVLMLGYMNEAALRETLTRGRVVFYSRSRQQLWEKGETSGNTLDVVQVRTDCDQDALLILVRPRGPACHRGTVSCFTQSSDHRTEGLGFLAQLEALIARRLHERPEGSYTTRLATAGVRRVAQKVGEEGVEVALAGSGGSDAELIAESADLLYHLLVLLQLRGTPLATVSEALRRRHRG